MTTEITWHPYPQEKPKAECGTQYKVKLSNGIVDDTYWRGEENFEWQWFDDKDVVAWAEMEEEE